METATTNWDLLAVYMYHFDMFEQARMRGDFVAAETYLQTNSHIAQANGDSWSIGIASTWLGRLALDRHDFARARHHLEQALRISGQYGEPFNTILGLEGIAALLAAEGHAEKALCLAGAAAEMRIATGLAAPLVHSLDLDRRLEPSRALLGTAVADAARLMGRHMTCAQAIAYALSPDEPVRLVPPGDALSLTPREREVAGLVGRGCSNRQIAEILVITTGTAGLHVQHIFDKLGLHNRSRLAAWAQAQGLSTMSEIGPDAPNTSGIWHDRMRQSSKDI